MNSSWGEICLCTCLVGWSLVENKREQRKKKSKRKKRKKKYEKEGREKEKKKIESMWKNKRVWIIVWISICVWWEILEIDEVCWNFGA